MSNIGQLKKEYYVHSNTIKDALAYINEEIAAGRSREDALQDATDWFELEPLDVEYIVGIIKNSQSK